MKIIFQTQSHDPEMIKDMKYDPSTNSIQYFYNGKLFTFGVEESVSSYVVVKGEEDRNSLEIINLESTGI